MAETTGGTDSKERVALNLMHAIQSSTVNPSGKKDDILALYSECLLTVQGALPARRKELLAEDAKAIS